MKPEGMLDLLGVSGGGTLGQSSMEQERSSLTALSGKDRGYKAGRLKSRGVRRKSEGFVVPEKACKKTRWREGALLWSRRTGSKREGMPGTANNPLEKARQIPEPAIGESQVMATTVEGGEGCDNWIDNPVKGRALPQIKTRASSIKKIIVKPCAGKPQARFERGLMETALRIA